MLDDVSGTKRLRGRPPAFSHALASEICERLAEGESLQSICNDEGMPAERTVRRWAIEDHEGFSPRYTRARELQAEHYADEIVAIADSVKGERESSAVVHAARLAMDARKWVAAKLLPKKYGDKLIVGGDPNAPLQITKIELVPIAPQLREGAEIDGPLPALAIDFAGLPLANAPDDKAE